MLPSDVVALPEYNGHKGVFSIADKKSGLKGFIAIHKANKDISAFGATRVVEYPSEKDALKDALRLARLMSYKSAMAGLPYGGGKAVLFPQKDVRNKDFFKKYARRISVLRGSFVTGADVGVSLDDVKVMRKHSPFIVGTHSNPVRFTSLGVFYALQVAAKNVFGNSSFSNKSIAIQGVGATGSELIKHIYPLFKKIYVADLDLKKLKNIKIKFPKIVITNSNKISKLEVDVFSPCAMYHSINSKNIDKIKARIVCGSANNQLETSEIGKKLFEKNILYCPDYVVNAGGLIAVADEYEHKNHRVKRVKKKLNIVKSNLRKIIKLSKSRKLPTNDIADLLAEKRFNSIK